MAAVTCRFALKVGGKVHRSSEAARIEAYSGGDFVGFPLQIKSHLFRCLASVRALSHNDRFCGGGDWFEHSSDDGEKTQTPSILFAVSEQARIGGGDRTARL